MARHEMIDGVMKELMRGIKIAAGPINQHNSAYNVILEQSVMLVSELGGRGGVGTDKGIDSVIKVKVKHTLIILTLNRN